MKDNFVWMTGMINIFFYFRKRNLNWKRTKKIKTKSIKDQVLMKTIVMVRKRNDLEVLQIVLRIVNGRLIA